MPSKEELETFDQIIKDSNKKLSTLKILSNFFDHADLIAIMIRTKVIHSLFETNKNLDIHKLDLFHIQYTNSLIELCQKLKKSKEQHYQVISDEIYINEDFISKLKLETDHVPFFDEAKVHSQKVCLKLAELYKLFISDVNASYNWLEMIEFSNKRSAEFYREISNEQFQQITSHDTKKVYQNAFAVFEKKLLGKLNIQNFKVKFLCGLIGENGVIEVFEFVNSNDKFIFIPSKKSFFLIEDSNTKGIDLSKNVSDKKKVIEQLSAKNTTLKEKLSTIKTMIPQDIIKVLESYLVKISDVNFLNDLQNVDEQTNILKAMLNINIK